ncbi:potassium channel family protein [Thalassotalea crassostreae]|uniref:potassium channel family protein n=1 Tax=Thalassotalea crassostreae TaxID=1763536 RepID=UPI000838F84D|nr:potassium channel family protein [Thalassotalea crassostreae]
MFVYIRKTRFYNVDEFGVKNYNNAFVVFVAMCVLFAVMSMASWAMLQYELQDKTANITNFGDALWTLQMTVSTVGYGDYHPVTLGGRVIATMMFYIGFGLIGFIATKVVRSIMSFSNTDVRNRELRKQNAEILERNKLLERKVDSLVETIARTKQG